jgi:PadR family transcriptional regulator PadR
MARKTAVFHRLERFCAEKLANRTQPKYSLSIYATNPFALIRRQTVVPTRIAMSLLDYHVLLALAGGPLYGYAIKETVAQESGGAVTPRAGSLYRVISRLTTAGLVAEAQPTEEPPPHPGHARRYYALTAVGRRELSTEAARLKRSAAMAQKRLGVAPGRP